MTAAAPSSIRRKVLGNLRLTESLHKVLRHAKRRKGQPITLRLIVSHRDSLVELDRRTAAQRP